MKNVFLFALLIALSSCSIQPNFNILLTPSSQQVTVGDTFTITADVVSDEVTCATFSHDNNPLISDTVSQGNLTTVYAFTPTEAGEFTFTIMACNSCAENMDGSTCVSDKVTITVVQ